MGYGINLSAFGVPLDNKGSAPTVTTVDTKANILALTPSSPQTALATDTGEFFVWDGSSWNVGSIALSTELPAPDMGYTLDNDKKGYGSDYIDGKKATNFAIGQFNDTPYNGALRLDQDQNPSVMQIYARDVWNQLFYDLTMENDEFQHVPQTYTINVRSGSSVELGLNNVPIVREYKVDMGCYPRPVTIELA